MDTPNKFDEGPNVSMECCMYMCRHWEETLFGLLPPSDHSPQCKNYVTESFFKVSTAGEIGPWCALETMAEVADLTEGEEGYDVVTITMTRDQFENLNEFEGF